jgi:hypothetical protein
MASELVPIVTGRSAEDVPGASDEVAMPQAHSHSLPFIAFWADALQQIVAHSVPFTATWAGTLQRQHTNLPARRLCQ